MSHDSPDSNYSYRDTFLVIHKLAVGYIVKVCPESGPSKMYAFTDVADVADFVKAHNFKDDAPR